MKGGRKGYTDAAGRLLPCCESAVAVCVWRGGGVYGGGRSDRSEQR